MKEVRGWWAGHCILLAADCGYLYVGEYALRWVSGWWALYNGQPILSQNMLNALSCKSDFKWAAFDKKKEVNGNCGFPSKTPSFRQQDYGLCLRRGVLTIF